MIYERAKIKTGLTYEQICSRCKTKITYMDDILQFRSWLPNGFIYCPKCRKQLPHKEDYVIKYKENISTIGESTSTRFFNNYCTGCGTEFGPNDYFCTKCGKRRD